MVMDSKHALSCLHLQQNCISYLGKRFLSRIPLTFLISQYFRDMKTTWRTQKSQVLRQFPGSRSEQHCTHYIVKVVLPTPKPWAWDTFKVIVYIIYIYISNIYMLSFQTSAAHFGKLPTVASFLWIYFYFQRRNRLPLHINNNWRSRNFNSYRKTQSTDLICLMEH